LSLSTTERPSHIFDNYAADRPAEELYVNQGAVAQEQYDLLIERGNRKPIKIRTYSALIPEFASMLKQIS